MKTEMALDRKRLFTPGVDKKQNFDTGKAIVDLTMTIAFLLL